MKLGITTPRAKQVIDGLDEAVTGMKVGEIRKLIVPPALSRCTVYPKFLITRFRPDF